MTAQDYLKNIEKALARGNATEHTHRPALQSFIESLADGITATNEPKRIKCGAPDYVVMRGETPLGYIEAKDVGESLDRVERSEQMARYLESLGNLILTDYLEFRWFVRGKHKLTARLAKADAKGKLKVEKDGAETVTQLLTAFFNADIPIIASPKELATRMAGIARLIRDTIRRAFTDEDKGGSLHQQMKGFRKVLLHDLTEDQFADMYAQTICYGLFAARCNARGSERFTREHAAYKLPKTNPFLRKMFGHIAGPDLDDRIVWTVDDLAELLNKTDISAILEDFGKRTRREDPVVHFYETFLAAYDPKMREARGVYYTPEPVVSYIVQSVDHILKTDFGLPEGLAHSGKIKFTLPDGESEIDTHKVLILDPATGTGTFLYEVIKQIYEPFKSNKGMWSGYVSEHLLPRLFGFELLMAPYAVAHMKLGLQLDEMGYDFKTDERLGVYLTNTLEEVQERSQLPNYFAEWLDEEANAANKIKQEAPVMVVLGNPPYSVTSQNRGGWVEADIQSLYYPDDKIKEANPKVLLDDYVKFIRFAQWRIEQTGYGILAFISNHGYLDNPTFRAMRHSLMETFDDIYALDLHGNSKKKERSPDGSKDENVFDIQQGVAIGIFIKRSSSKTKLATVYHSHLWGCREIYDKNAIESNTISGGKYYWLSQNKLSTTTWEGLAPQAPYYLFVPQDTDLQNEYEQGLPLREFFQLRSMGIKTNRDHLLIDFDKEKLVERISKLASTDLSDDDARNTYELSDSPYWNTRREREKLRRVKWRSNVQTVLYRPFDARSILYQQNLIEIGRGGAATAVMRHMISGNNIGLLATRQTKDKWDVLVTNKICGHKACAAYDINYLHPLYLYPDETKGNLFDTSTSGNRRVNLTPSFINSLTEKLKLADAGDGKGDLIKSFGPEDALNYMYAVFYSPTYRSRYAEFLKMDFPRLPITSNADLFRSLCQLGAELVALHLMEKHARAITGYPIPGDSSVESVRYTEPGQGSENGRVWINKAQYFEGVPPEVWAFHVGGYQVCQKWLKDRKGRKLTYDELTHYHHIVSALSETIRLMAEIDEAIEGAGGWPIQ